MQGPLLVRALSSAAVHTLASLLLMHMWQEFSQGANSCSLLAVSKEATGPVRMYDTVYLNHLFQFVVFLSYYSEA